MPAAPVQYKIEDRLQLNWRDALRRKNPLDSDAILKGLHSLLTQIDDEGYLSIEVSNSQSTQTVKLERVQEGGNPPQYQVVRFSKPTRKLFTNNMVCLLTTAHFYCSPPQDYFAKLELIIEYLCLQIASHSPVKLRQAGYAQSLVMTQPQLRKMVCDIALTLNMHPANLGINPEENALIYLSPQKVRLKAWICSNPFTFAKTKKVNGLQAAMHSCEIKTIQDGGVTPSRIMELRLTKGSVRAVVVVEHKNIGRELSWVQDNFKDVIIISVCRSSRTLEYGADQITVD